MSLEIKPKHGTIVVAIESGKMLLKNGREFLFVKGRTRIRVGSEPYDLNPHFFAEDNDLTDVGGVETADRDPGRKRGER